LSAATNLKLILTPPPGALTQGQPSQTVTASFYTDGTDGILKYVTISGDVPSIPQGAAPQLWSVRASFTLSGWTGKSEPDTFYVDP
jgi:hypothetical protein